MKIFLIDLAGFVLLYGGLSLGLGGVLFVPWLDFIEFAVAPKLHLSFEVSLVLTTLSCSALMIVSGVVLQSSAERLRFNANFISRF